MREWLKRAKTRESGNGSGWLVAEKVLAQISAGKISTATIDDNVGRMLRVMFISGQFDKPHHASGEMDTSEQRAVARKAATESIVLLKNDSDLLPLNPSRIHSLVVIGPNAAVARTGGGGSSLVTPKYSISPLKGIQDRGGEHVQVSYALGVSMEGEDPGKDTRSCGSSLEAKPSARRRKQTVPSSWSAGTPNLSRRVSTSSRSICPPGRTNSSQPWRRSIKTTSW